MKYLLLIASLLLGLCSPSSAQFNGCQAGFCAVKAAGAPALPNPVFVSSDAFANSANTWTTATANIGTANATRRVIVMMLSGNSSGRTVSGATINGVSATTVLDNTFNGSEWVGCVTAVVPSGTTGVNITITMSDTLFSNAQYAVYTVDDTTLLSSTPITGVSGTLSGTSLAPNASATVNGFILGAVDWGNGSSKTPVTITSYAIDATSPNQYYFFSLTPVASTGTATATINWTNAFEGNSVITAWR